MKPSASVVSSGGAGGGLCSQGPERWREFQERDQAVHLERNTSTAGGDVAWVQWLTINVTAGVKGDPPYVAIMQRKMNLADCCLDIPQTADLDLDLLSRALGSRPPVSYAAAHAYPASAPAFVPTPELTRQKAAQEALRLYVHVPFCAYRCSFCFFAVRVGAQHNEMEAYVQALLHELEWAEAGTPLVQMFMGGGTPTMLPPDLMDQLLAGIFGRLHDRRDQVHCVETSPDSLTEEHLAVLIRHGIGRVSMGTQSLHDDQLGDVNRHHTAEQTLRACKLALDAGMILNVDLMYGLPGQTQASFRRDVATLADNGVPSLTIYDLRLNERTPVARNLQEKERLELAQLLSWRQFVGAAARDFGYQQTRWHTFKRMDGSAARHQRAPHHMASGLGYQLGIGLSARSHLGDTVYRNHSQIQPYLERIATGKSPVEDSMHLAPADRRSQYVLSSIGDGRPLNLEDYEVTFGSAFLQDFEEPASRLIAAGLIRQQGNCLELSPIGRLLYDRVAYNFYPSHALQWLQGRQRSATAQAQAAS